MSDTRIIHVWSGPRSLSTALMYSFAQRPDCKVFDEPLYSNYLRVCPQVTRPYREEFLKACPDTAAEAIQKLNDSSKTQLVYAKHIAKFYTSDIDLKSLCTEGARHVMLIRNPLDMIMAWNKVENVHGSSGEEADADPTNLLDMVQIFTKVRKLTGRNPFVVDADSLKGNSAEEILSELCRRLQIPFYQQQLHWPAGPKPDIDGFWAPYWYETVHKSTGFNAVDGQAYRSNKYTALNADQMDAFREVLPLFDLLRMHAIGVDVLAKGLSHCPYPIPLTPQPVVGGPMVEAAAIVSTTAALSTSLTDPRNVNILIWVGDRLVPREYAKVSVFDSSVQGGDGVWEGVRVYKSRVFKLEEHLTRLMASARALAYAHVPTKDYIRQAVFSTLRANSMTTDVHIRITLTRGTKVTSSMNPLFNIFGCVLLVVAEFKPVGNAATYDNNSGVKLITSALRRNSPSYLDSKIHHCNMLNNILPKIQANQCGAADALMLDGDGYVSETNATNVFMVKDRVVYTPTVDSCLPGVTRRTVIDIVATLYREGSMPQTVVERRLSLAEFHSADEVFTTGSMGELTPVVQIDGRNIGYHDSDAVCAGDVNLNNRRPVTTMLQNVYRGLTETEGVVIE